MRITFVLPVASLAGGIRVVATYARFLHERGHEVTVVSQPVKAARSWKSMIKAVLGRPRPREVTPTSLLDFLGPRHRILERRRPVTAEDLPDADVVVATWWETAEWVADLPAAKGRKFYLLQGYEVFPHLPVERVIATYHLPLRKIAVSNYIRRSIETNHGVAGIEVAPNAVDLERFTGPQRRRNASFTVGFLYSTNKIKNIAMALEAIRLARERLPDLKTVAFGASPPAAELPLPSWVEYHQAPPEAEIPKVYASCDAWLFPSEKEGFGLPILEAMACGTPVLATRAGAAPDLIDGSNGTLLHDSASVFADEILRFARMPEESWREISAGARRTAMAHSWQAATDRLLAILSPCGARPDGVLEPKGTSPSS